MATNGKPDDFMLDKRAMAEIKRPDWLAGELKRNVNFSHLEEPS